MHQLLEQRIYKDYEIKIFGTMTGFKLQAFKGTKAFQPVVSIDFQTNMDIKHTEGRSGIESLVSFLQHQIDNNYLIG